jgi:hypothetical protein
MLFSLADHHCFDEELWGIEVALVEHAHSNATSENHLTRIRSHSPGEKSNQA